MKSKPKVGQKIRLNRVGIRQIFNCSVVPSALLNQVFTITKVDDDSMTEPEKTWMIEVDDPEINQFMIDNWCFDLVI
jgi:hypothetical protein